jgi:hypothetical protein
VHSVWKTSILFTIVTTVPTLSVPFVNAQNTVNNLYGPVPVAYAKWQAAKDTQFLIGSLPTLMGAESTFTYQNFNIERGIVWNQENAINRGLQVNQTIGKYLSAAFSWNDGYYSNRYSWLSGSATLTKGPHSLVYDGMGNLGQTAFQTAATPVQNNSYMHAVTRIRLRVDRYIGEDRQAHLLSVFGNDSDVGAITAAVHEKAAFSLTFPDGTTKDVSLGEHASCYKGAVTLPGRKHPVRHLLAVSQELHTNGSAGRTILLRYRREEAWATLVSFLGLPADPTWAEHILGIVEGKKRIEEIDGIGCQPVLISATTEEVLAWIGEGLGSGDVSFPVRNGPIPWPRFTLTAALKPTPAGPESIGSGIPVSQ